MGSTTHQLSIGLIIFLFGNCPEVTNYIKDACSCLSESAGRECYFDEPTPEVIRNYQISQINRLVSMMYWWTAVNKVLLMSSE